MNKLLLRVVNLFGYFIAKILTVVDFIFRKKVSLFLKLAIEKYMSTTITNNGIIFDATEMSNYYRGRDLLKREPDTLYWIDNYMNDNDVFYDVGANIGTYSLYAANKGGLKIFAFEPESSNYYYLNKNIYLNGMDDRILALNVALNNEDKLSYLRLIKFIVGGTEINFDEKLDHKRRKFTPVYNQGVIGYSLDSLILKYNLPCPNHIKIDVGGDDLKIFEGMRETLLNENMKTLMFELDVELDERIGIADELIKLGYELIKDDSNLRNIEYEKTKIYNHFFRKITSDEQ
jgi:FkbM family methyltransferase